MKKHNDGTDSMTKSNEASIIDDVEIPVEEIVDVVPGEKFHNEIDIAPAIKDAGVIEKADYILRITDTFK